MFSTGSIPKILMDASVVVPIWNINVLSKINLTNYLARIKSEKTEMIALHESFQS